MQRSFCYSCLLKNQLLINIIISAMKFSTVHRENLRGTSLISRGDSFNVVMSNLSAVSLTILWLVQLIMPEKKKNHALY